MMRSSPWGISLLGLGLGMLFIGLVGAELYTQRVSLIVVLAGLVLLLFGWQYLWIVSFPIAFLTFMIPLPTIVVNSIAFPLQLFAAKTATFCLFSLGIPVLREGNLISLVGMTLEVNEACSGLRSLLALLALRYGVWIFFPKIPLEAMGLDPVIDSDSDCCQCGSREWNRDFRAFLGS